MLSKKTKEIFFALSSPLMRINMRKNRIFNARKLDNIKIHLGPGQKRYIDGWINIDANLLSAKVDLWSDLRFPLPFNSCTVAAAYSHHVVEHLPDLDFHFNDVFRCLKPGGVYRVGVPNADAAIAKFIASEASWFSDFPDKRQSVGGRLDNFILCRNEHLAIMTYSYVEELMQNAGFFKIERQLPVKQTKYPELFGDCLAKERESDFDFPHTLIVEGVKP